MRKISLVFLSAVFLATTSLSAANSEPASDASKKITTHIAKLLKDNNFDNEEDITATVMITINDDSEIVVLSVETGDKNLEQVLKSRLNYEKVDLAPQFSGKTYKVPVRVTS